MRPIIGLIVALLVAAASATSKTVLRFQNQSNDFLSVHWVDPRSGETVPIKTDVSPRSQFTLNSYIGHRFEIWQELDPNTGRCGSEDSECDLIGDLEVTKETEQGEPSEYSMHFGSLKKEDLK